LNLTTATAAGSMQAAHHCTLAPSNVYVLSEERLFHVSRNLRDARQ